MNNVVALKPEATALTVHVPHSVAAEQALLGALMVNNRLYDDLQGTLLAEYFYVPLHAVLFEKIESLIGRGREANPITLREMLRHTPYDSDNSLFPHLSQIFENAGLTGDIKSLAEVIHTAYMQRQLMGLGDSLRQQAGTASDVVSVKDVLDAASGELFKLAETGQGGNSVKGLRESLREVIAAAELAKREGGGITGVATDFKDLDNLLGGLQKSDLIILGARPSMGKTSLIINIAQNAAIRKARGEAGGAAVGVFSLEMSAEQITARMLSSAANVSSHQISSGHLNDADFGRIMAAAGQLAELPMYIDDTPALSVNAMRAKARRMKRQYGVGLIIVDYLQLMTAPGKGNDSNRVQEIGAISQGLKQIARELNVPVIAASQLSRSVEARDNKRPQLADLRESGSIEQDADLVWFLYREEYYLSRQLGAGDTLDGDKKVLEMKDRLEKVRGVTELIVSKNRKGPTDTVKLLFHGATTTFHSFSGRSDYDSHGE
ncbi:MAG: replicative DNA helicase [Alphaproteobacteria bacterium]